MYLFLNLFLSHFVAFFNIFLFFFIFYFLCRTSIDALAFFYALCYFFFHFSLPLQNHHWSYVLAPFPYASAIFGEWVSLFHLLYFFSFCSSIGLVASAIWWLGLPLSCSKMNVGLSLSCSKMWEILADWKFFMREIFHRASYDDFRWYNVSNFRWYFPWAIWVTPFQRQSLFLALEIFIWAIWGL